ncbi:hypothetical protein HK107_11490 [Parvularcula sp. ZS-1/3]|uniref:Secreted protein n=1 Tax=Parvularcula mediterranea TaxID=2732508 RepID=A0A7Y3W630_9PROT|nr:hypothetical protein [Parvularcula mediterranea]NNU16942.1 hypothetical protein [Parvularcula mediterranea]
MRSRRILLPSLAVVLASACASMPPVACGCLPPQPPEPEEVRLDEAACVQDEMRPSEAEVAQGYGVDERTVRRSQLPDVQPQRC